MERDQDLIRQLLFLIERRDVSNALHTDTIAIEGYTDTQIGLHLNMMADAGFLVAEYDRSTTNPNRIIRTRLAFDLSWSGHEYLDSVRDPKIWKQTKSIAKKAGSGSFDFLLEIAKALVRQKLVESGLVAS